MAPAPKLIYFDLGNVLLHFDHHKANRQMAELSQVSPQAVWDLVFAGESALQWKYERGQVTSREFYEQYCEALDTRPDYEQLLMAASDMFTLNTAIVPVIRQLRSFGHRLGILSNTCPAHWEFVIADRFRIIPSYFEVIALSYQLGAMKPEPESYQAAARLAGVAAEEIFYIDDRVENVEGACAAGYRAFSFTTPRQLAIDLRANGVPLVI
jgi:glucose-1-phosphatase